MNASDGILNTRITNLETKHVNELNQKVGDLTTLITNTKTELSDQHTRDKNAIIAKYDKLTSDNTAAINKNRTDFETADAAIITKYDKLCNDNKDELIRKIDDISIKIVNAFNTSIGNVYDELKQVDSNLDIKYKGITDDIITDFNTSIGKVYNELKQADSDLLKKINDASNLIPKAQDGAVTTYEALKYVWSDGNNASDKCVVGAGQTNVVLKDNKVQFVLGAWNNGTTKLRYTEIPETTTAHNGLLSIDSKQKYDNYANEIQTINQTITEVKQDLRTETQARETEDHKLQTSIDTINNTTIPTLHETITTEVGNKYDPQISEIKGKKRTAIIKDARNMAIYLTRKITQYSTTEIGNYFDRDHSTITHSIDKVDQERKQNSDIATALDSLENTIKSKSK